MEKTFTFDFIPSKKEDIKSEIYDPFEVAALTTLVLCNYKNDVNVTCDMLNVLKGPKTLTPYEIQFLRDRLRGKEYKPYSFFEGATPQNDYTPNKPFTITVSDNPYSYQDENYANLYLKSSGADSSRSIKMRKKPSTGQWFLWEIFILSDIRISESQDVWA